jgi:hypothetical protein
MSDATVVERRHILKEPVRMTAVILRVSFSWDILATTAAVSDP